MSSPDQPFVLRGGEDEQTALANRINAIDRIQFLTEGIDLRKKSATYLKALDLEMWKRWYKDEPATKKIDETFCQRAAEVVIAMEGKDIKLNETRYEKARQDHQKKMESKDGSEHAQSSSQDAGKAKQNKSRVREGGSARSN